VNTSVPFPTLVQAIGPVTIAKANGIWNIGFNINALGRNIPPTASLPTDYAIFYDSIVGNFFKLSITDIRTAPTLTVATLPAAASNKGVRFLVSDATATTFWTIVAGAGANTVPVTSDGTNWRIG
jgi:hypothetical protein